MTSIKLLWLPGLADYRLRVFAGPNSQARAFAGELVLVPEAAKLLHDVVAAYNAVRPDEALSEAGWVFP